MLWKSRYAGQMIFRFQMVQISKCIFCRTLCIYNQNLLKTNEFSELTESFDARYIKNYLS